MKKDDKKKHVEDEVKDDHLHIRIGSQKLEQCRALAEADGRTLSNWVERIIDLAIIEAKEGA